MCNSTAVKKNFRPRVQINLSGPYAKQRYFILKKSFIAKVRRLLLQNNAIVCPRSRSSNKSWAFQSAADIFKIIRVVIVIHLVVFLTTARQVGKR